MRREANGGEVARPGGVRILEKGGKRNLVKRKHTQNQVTGMENSESAGRIGEAAWKTNTCKRGSRREQLKNGME